MKKEKVYLEPLREILEGHTDKEWRNMDKKVRKSKSFKSIFNYFSHFIRDKSFQEKILAIRIKYKIPPKGFTSNKSQDRYFPPAEWLGWDKDKKLNSKSFNKIRDEVDNLCNYYHLYIPDWSLILESYIFYNKINIFIDDLSSFSSCHLFDVYGTLNEMFTKKYVRFNNANQFTFPYMRAVSEMTSAFPIAILVNPYASENEIKDYLKKTWETVQQYQKKYRKVDIKVGKIRTKSGQKIYDFIWENQNLKRAILAEKVNKKFGRNIDAIYIRNVISRESKRRGTRN